MQNFPRFVLRYFSRELSFATFPRFALYNFSRALPYALFSPRFTLRIFPALSLAICNFSRVLLQGFYLDCEQSPFLSDSDEEIEREARSSGSEA